MPTEGRCTILTAVSESLEMVLIRHGQSTANAAGVWQGQLDCPLSDEGRQQARFAGRTLAGEGISGFYSSPLSRAHETARIIAREAGFGDEIFTLPGLSERHGGRLEGTTAEEREAQDPEFVRKFLALPEEERWPLAGAETDEEILARFAGAVAEIRARHNNGRVVIVTHGGVMRAFLHDVFGPTVLPGSERAPNASITRLSWDADREPRLLEVAATDHIPPAEQTRTTQE